MFVININKQLAIYQKLIRLTTPRIQPVNQMSWSLLKWLFRYFVHKLQLGYNEKIEKGDDSVMDLQNFTKSKSGHLHLGHNL